MSVTSLSDGLIENTIDYNIHNKQPRTIKNCIRTRFRSV